MGSSKLLSVSPLSPNKIQNKVIQLKEQEKQYEKIKKVNELKRFEKIKQEMSEEFNKRK